VDVHLGKPLRVVFGRREIERLKLFRKNWVASVAAKSSALFRKNWVESCLRFDVKPMSAVVTQMRF
jgi:hypothetical protein